MERTLKGADMTRHKPFLRNELSRGWGESIGNRRAARHVNGLPWAAWQGPRAALQRGAKCDESPHLRGQCPRRPPGAAAHF